MEVQAPALLAPHAESLTVDKDVVKWRVVSRGLGGVMYLDVIELDVCDSGKEVLTKLRARHARKRNITTILHFQKEAVATTALKYLSPSLVEEHRFPCVVDVESQTRNDLLSRAFERPELLESTADYVRANSQFEVDSTSHEALLVYREVDKMSLCLLLVTALCISIAAGVIVGIWAHRMDVGVATSSGMAAVLSCIEVLVLWLST